jgi:molybdate transport system substrate-binding protein
MLIFRVAVCLLLLAELAIANAAGAPPIAAAADLKFALAESCRAFSRRRAGHAVKLSFGSSGNFAHQLEQGAPFRVVSLC